jgi:probable HAF family extracellular repeat protein
MRQLGLFVAGIAVLLGSLAAAAPSGDATRAEARWTITDLGTLGGEESYAAAVNARGHVVGWSETAKGNTHPFLWRDGRMTDLGAMDHTSAWATAINDRGVVVGRFRAEWNDEDEGYASALLGFVWEQGFMTGLTPDPDGALDTRDDGDSEVRAINERGEIVGWAAEEYYDPHAYLWSSPDFSERGSGYPYHHEGSYLRPTELGRAYDINEQGQVVGEVQKSYDHPLRAVRWWKGDVTELGTLGGSSTARAINDREQIVGRSRVSAGWHAFLWEEHDSPAVSGWTGVGLLGPIAALVGVAILLGAYRPLGRRLSRAWYLAGGGIFLLVFVPAALLLADRTLDQVALSSPSPAVRDLGTLGGRPHSYAVALNERAQVIGWCSNTPGTDEELPPTPRAFLWENGEMRDLGTLGGTYSIAYAINEAGQVAGQSQTADGQWHAVVWENGEMSALDTLGGKYSAALAINDAGQIVGWSRTRKDVKHAVLWTPRRDG